MNDKRRRFEAEVLPHLDAAQRFARWLAPAPGEADDLVQEAVLRAFRGFERMRGTHVKAWLLAIVKNCHRTSLKQRLHRPLTPLPEDPVDMQTEALVSADDPELAALLTQRQQLLARLLAALPEEQREVLILREIEELDYRTIAAVIEAPIGTVMSRLARARSALRARWIESEEMACP